VDPLIDLDVAEEHISSLHRHGAVPGPDSVDPAAPFLV
jgi:hypothetical protein